MSKEGTDIEFFQFFSDNPRKCNLETIQGSHRYIANAIKGAEESPKNSTLINIFNEFAKDEIKDYVYHRMKKSILLELALCILQEIAVGGPERARNLQLQVTKASSGGKQVTIAPSANPVDEFPMSPSDRSSLLEIDEASFTLNDSHGKSPEKTVVSGKGQKQPYSAPDAKGYFTPEKPQGKSAWQDSDEAPSTPPQKSDEKESSIGSETMPEVTQ